jgi:hypothetical protein
MRSTLITSVLAASVLSVGFAATAGAAESGDGGSVATPTTVPFNLDALGLTPEQMDCLLASAANPDLSDMTAMMELMAQCGIDPMSLGAGVTTPTVPGVPTIPGVPTTLPLVVPTVPVGPLDPAAAAAVLLMLGVDPTTAQCIETGLSAAISPGDDDEALAILQTCGLTLNGLLTGIVAANAAASAPVLPTIPGVPTTVAGVPTTASGEAPGPIVQQLIDTVQSQYGITLTVDQATCLLDNITTLDPEDAQAMLALMEECGISLDQLAG